MFPESRLLYILLDSIPVLIHIDCFRFGSITRDRGVPVAYNVLVNRRDIIFEIHVFETSSKDNVPAAVGICFQCMLLANLPGYAWGGCHLGLHRDCNSPCFFFHVVHFGDCDHVCINNSRQFSSTTSDTISSSCSLHSYPCCDLVRNRSRSFFHPLPVYRVSS
jgi:hypothetical protein